MIDKLTQEFQIQHKKSTLYHPQANGVVEALNNILENTMTKIWKVQRDDWDQKIYVVLWAYGTNYKKLTGKTKFWLDYGQEVVLSMEYSIPSIRIDSIMEMTDVGAIE